MRPRALDHDDIRLIKACVSERDRLRSAASEAKAAGDIEIYKALRAEANLLSNQSLAEKFGCCVDSIQKAHRAP